MYITGCDAISSHSIPGDFVSLWCAAADILESSGLEDTVGHVWVPRSACQSSLWRSWFLKCRAEWSRASWTSPSSRSPCIWPGKQQHQRAEEDGWGSGWNLKVCQWYGQTETTPRNQTVRKEQHVYLTEQLCSFFSVLRVHGERQDGVQTCVHLFLTCLLVLDLQLEMNSMT